MKTSLGLGHEPSLQRLIIASVLLHFILMAFLFIPFKTGEREFKNYYVTLVEPAKMSGGGGAAARKAEEKPAVKKEASANKKIAEDKAIAETKELMALKAEKSQKAAEAVAKEIERLKALKALSKGKEKKRDIEDVRKGIEASAKGVGGASGKGGHKASDSDCPYCTLITDKIWSGWVYPDFNSAGLEVEISIKIDSKGKVVSQKKEKSSGNDLFDQSALKAISKASPLPPPPPSLEMDDIVVRFHL